jgi:hypothetical protein
MVNRPLVEVGPVDVRLLCCVSGICVLLFLTCDMLMSIAFVLVQNHLQALRWLFHLFEMFV